MNCQCFHVENSRRVTPQKCIIVQTYVITDVYDGPPRQQKKEKDLKIIPDEDFSKRQNPLRQITPMSKKVPTSLADTAFFSSLENDIIIL